MIDIVFNDITDSLLKLVRRKAQNPEFPSQKIGERILAFPLQLDRGGLEDNGCDGPRKEYLHGKTVGIWDEDKDSVIEVDCFAHSMENLAILKSQSDKESVRIWYSEEPEEFCGFCWMLSLLRSWNVPKEKIWYVYRFSEKGIYDHKLWTDEVLSCMDKQRQVTDSFEEYHTELWTKLKTENAPLRVVVNGQLISAKEDFYDSFILAELQRESDTFTELWLSWKFFYDRLFMESRIEAMIEKGVLEEVKELGEDEIFYKGRILKKKRWILRGNKND